MKRFIDRIYSTKRQHVIDDEYESIGEMYKNKHHKKEPYIFTISASNSVGDSTVSDPTNDILPYTVPSIPVITSVQPVNANPPKPSFDASSDLAKVGETVSVNFNLLTGTDIGKTGDTINYKVSAVPSNNSTATPITSTGTSSPIIVGGLTNGTEYIFTMTATNSVGTSLISNSINGTPKGAPQKIIIKNITIKPDCTEFTIVADIPIPDNSVYNVYGDRTIKYLPIIYAKNRSGKKVYSSTDFYLNVSSSNSNVVTASNSNVTISNITSTKVTATIVCKDFVLDDMKDLFSEPCAFYIKSLSDFCWRDDYIMNSTGTDVNWIYIGKPGKPEITSTIDNKNGSVTINFTGSDNGTYGEAGLQVFNNLKYTLKTTLATGSSLPSGSSLPAEIVTSSIRPITVSGLVNGVNYIFTLYSTNSYIETANNINKTINSDTFTSNIVKPSTPPRNPPINISALTSDDGTVNVSFTPIGTIGAAPAQYYRVKVTSTSPAINTITATGPSSPIKVSGLTLGTNYSITVSVFNGLFSDESSPITIIPSKKANKITSITPTPESKLIKLTFKKPEDNGSAITSYIITAYYTKINNNVTSTYKEIIQIPVPATGTSNNYSIDSSNNVSIILYTKSNNVTFTLDTTVQGTTDAEKTTNQINSATEATTTTLSTSVQPYARVPLLYYPIGNEREGFYNSQNNKNVKKNNNITYGFIIFIIFVILYFVMNMNNPKKNKKI